MFPHMIAECLFRKTEKESLTGTITCVLVGYPTLPRITGLINQIPNITHQIQYVGKWLKAT